jgi:Ca2+-transporting ATPase
MGTETGRVAELLGEEGPGPTPLQQQLDVLGKRLAALAVLAVAVVFGVQLYQGSTFADAAIGAVALAVAAIPEGLPAVVTVTLAVGVHQLAMRNAIVKRLASVETLGATTVICSDKTGTLTRNEMSAEILVVDGRELDADDGWGADVAASVLEVAVLCNEAERHEGEVVGDPTETALLVLAEQHGVDTAATRAVHPRSAEIPFDSTTKWMATFHRDGDGVAIAVKGAPDALLTRCRAGRDGSPVDSDGVAATNERLAGRGLRVLAMASRSVAADDFEAARSDTETGLAGLVDDLTFEGLVGIVDPPRMEAADAIELCRRAGVSVKMITGDHAVTAGAIAERLGIEGEVITGAELERMDDDELERRIDAIGVCARVSPEHKVRVVQALQANGHVVAMTGDGVNDAAALRRAEIGVAMGITGTEVTKEAGDMILADDNFATIVGAVERGRAIYDNIVKFVRFQLTTNLAAIGTFLVASLTGLPIPFTALQVLYVNLIADGPPAMSLGVDRPDPGVMDRPPRQPGAPILTGARIARLLWAAGVMVAGTLAVLVLAGDAWGEAVGQTMAFTTFVAFQMVNVLNARSEQGSVLDRYTLSNRALWLAIGSVLVIQVLIVQLPVLESLFDTVALSAGQWAICVSVAFSVLVAEEARKAISRALSSRRP